MAINEEVDLENITIDANISSGMSISSVGVGGPRGEKGDKGDKGDTGATGPANTLTIGTVTKGDEADATIIGEAPNQTLNLTLPKGDKGDKGDRGDNGDTGPAGPQGLPGPQGAQGPKGDTGSQGPRGADGEDAKINGVNTLSIAAGDNISLAQSGGTLTISSTAGGSEEDSTTITKNSQDKIQTVAVIDRNTGYADKTWIGTKQQYNAIQVKDLNTLYYITDDTDDIYVTKTVDDLVNYYLKSETFTKQEVNNLISAITTMDIQVVQTLPTQDISTTTIYLVPKQTAGTNDAYDEYIYVSNSWEHIGSTDIDLTNYVTNTDYATNTKGGVIKTNSARATSMTYAGTLQASNLSYSDYQSAHNSSFIGKGTLENVITGKGLGTYSKPSGGIPSTDLASAVQTSLGKADGSVQLDGGSTAQTVTLTSGNGTTALGVKSATATNSYLSFSNSGGWLGSYGVSSAKKPVFYNGTSYTMATTDDVPKLVTLTQAAYDALVSSGTVDADTYYFIEET